MDPPPEEQNNSKINATIKKEKQPKCQHQNGQIDLKINNSMQNHELQGLQVIRTESIGYRKEFDYSMNSSYSLHSHFSSAQKIEYSKAQKDEIVISEESPETYKIKPEELNQCPLNDPIQIDVLDYQEQSLQGNFMKNKMSNDSREIEILTKSIGNVSKEAKSEKQYESEQRISYTSCLHQIVDSNHLESPARQFQDNHQQKKQQILEAGSNELKCLQKNDQKLQKAAKNQITPKLQMLQDRPLIRPIQISQKEPESQKQSQMSLSQQKNKRQMRQQLQIRRIPSNLYESYDELLLTVNNNQKVLGKNIISPIRLKDKSNFGQMNKNRSKENQKFDDLPKLSKRPDKIQTNLKKTTLDEELLVSLPIVQGYCQLKTDNSQIYQTKYVINKNTISFQTFEQILIISITKVKFIEKDEKQITIKVTYEQTPNAKPQNLLIHLLTQSKETYFFESYEFFSQIILRKLLLMKLTINELNERYEIESPVKSPQSSPGSSPLSLPSILPRKPSQNIQMEGPTLLQSNLYKKSTFFSSWEKKYFALTSKCLQSYSSPPINGQKQKPSTQLSKTSQIWTRFELIYGYLVVKMWHSKIEKFQIGIPLCDFTNPEGKNNWLYGFSKNLVWRKKSAKDQKMSKTLDN